MVKASRLSPLAGQNIEQMIVDIEQAVVNCTIPTSENVSFRSLLLGLYTRQHGHGIGHRTWQQLPLLQAIHRLAASHGREYASVQVNVSVATEQRGPLHLHKDSFNLKGYDNMIMVLGSYRGGRLWVQTDKPSDEVVPRKLLKPKLQQQHQDDTLRRMRGKWITPRRGQWIALDASKYNAVEEVFEGIRISVVTYCPAGLTRVGSAIWKQLHDLKFPCKRLCELSDEETSWWWHYWHRERTVQTSPVLKAGHIMGETQMWQCATWVLSLGHHLLRQLDQQAHCFTLVIWSPHG
eukprot:2756919-Amphidinium_carterae.2